MIECPWCQNEIEIKNGKCPVCHRKLHDVSDSDFDISDSTDSEPLHYPDTHYDNNPSVVDTINDNFKCAKCQCDDCRVKEVAMTGTGLSKLLDIQHNHFLFVSCNHCGFVEIYDPSVLRGKNAGTLGTVMDILFG
ncbi:zinc ribbon domain-containing protein [Paenibacillus endoradicis]|uniref:zinc ribbon domain-containing protein n=1 Tax=Paenibacillus endoradicis TaxID=2972487 RepID=UPI0021595CE5|nr:zinc ribbon domain-containing protein [Paenibacillus endoradicis]MCR8656629.1 zinc ribbon domain-containing protein [Paenibacillus endoradicis]